MTESPNFELLDKIVCGYRITQEIGEGGMGKVYLAESAYLTEYKQQVAIKTLTPKNERQAALLQDLFVREANIQVQLKHPHIVSVIQFAIEHGAHFLLLEYIPGYEYRGRHLSNVADVLRYETGAMPYQRAMRLFAQALDAMDYSHNFKYRWEGEERTGIVHRDIKPANMLLMNADTIKLSDFGIVKVQQRRESATSRLTPGTSAYMAPEAIQGPHNYGLLELDGRSDIYSLGITLYEMLTGKLPFKPDPGENPDVSMRRKQVDEMPPPPSTIYPQIPEALDAVVMKALQKNPDRRYQSARDFKAAIFALNESLSLGLKDPYDTNDLAAKTQGQRSAPTAQQGTYATQYVDMNAAATTRGLGAAVETNVRGWNPTPIPGSVTDVPFPSQITATPGTTFPSVVPETPATPSRGKLFATVAVLAVALAAVGAVLYPKLFPSNAATTATPSPAPTIKTPADMVVIPGGTYRMGRDLDEAMKNYAITSGSAQEKPFRFDYPAHAETVKPFYLDLTEVSRRAYGEFVKATQRNAPSDWGASTPPLNTEDMPVTHVSFNDASDYCAWRTATRNDGLLYRLPTEPEWEFAARGKNAGEPNQPLNLYPWGDEWTPGNANTRESRLAHPQIVTANRQAASPFGALNLAGNVYEWTATDFQHYPGSDQETPREAGYQGTYQVVRGGSFDFAKEYAMTTTRVWAKPTSQGPRLGFRCAAEVKR
ncbi:MAG: SUMF1/EgtB/PvdO family nonheme iron enzyme [Acidobacteria bacterium]|nr:SUMF1/EgtB/PvdO family nonheme iron enzyme [Acidobacteriota bacterium]